MQEGDGHDGTGQENKSSRTWRDYFPFMVRLAQRRVGSGHAEDIANVALLDAYNPNRPKPSLAKDVEVKRYLRALVRFRVLEHVKRHKKWRNEVSLVDESELLCSAPTTGQSPELAFECLLVRRALDKLTPFDKELVLGYHVDGFTAAELAKLHKMKESTIRSRIERATKRLASYLAPRSSKSTSLGVMCALTEPLRIRLSKAIQSMTNSIQRLFMSAFAAKSASFIVVPMTMAFVPADASTVQAPPQPNCAPVGVVEERPALSETLPSDIKVDGSAAQASLPNSDEFGKKDLHPFANALAPTNLPKPPRPKAGRGASAGDTSKTSAPRESASAASAKHEDISCNNAYGLAQANERRHKFSDCLKLLREPGLQHCADTDWVALREACEQPAPGLRRRQTSP